MAYADYSFYTTTYYGDVLTATNAAKWLDRASDELDTLTFGRLTFAFPTVEAHVIRVKKAACALAEALCCIDEQRRAASLQLGGDGNYHGAVASISSGRESISFASAASAAAASVYAAAAASKDAETKLLMDLAARYLANIPDANGINLLFAGTPVRIPCNE